MGGGCSCHWIAPAATPIPVLVCLTMTLYKVFKGTFMPHGSASTGPGTQQALNEYENMEPRPGAMAHACNPTTLGDCGGQIA